MLVLKAPSVELAVDDRIKDRLGALMEVSTLDFRAMTFAAGLDPATSFRGIHIQFLDFGESDLTGFDFSGADLTGCNFSRAKTEKAVFAGACLNEVRGLKNQIPKIFISYTSDDKIIAKSVAEKLKFRGIPYFYDVEHISPVQNIAVQISDEIQESSHFLLIATKNTFNSSWVSDEIKSFMEKIYRERVIFIIALFGLTIQEIPIRIPYMHIVDLNNLELSIEQIVKIFNNWRISPELSAPQDVYDKSLFNETNQGRKQDIDDDMSEMMKRLIMHELHDRLNLFHPGHYGFDLHEVHIDNASRFDFVIEASGNISATAQLGGSSEENSFNVDYHSRFDAVFSVFPAEDEDNVEGLDLDELNLEKIGWFDADD